MTAVSLITQGDIEVNGVGPQSEQQSEQQGDHRRSWSVARTVIPSDVGFEPHRFACQGRPKWSTIADSSRPRTVKTSEFTMPNHEPAARPDPPAEPGPSGHDRPIPSGPLATPARPADSAWGNLERRLLDLIVTNYTNGWQPAELLRHARREGTRGAAVLAAHAVAADHLGRPADAYHALWGAHVEGLDLPFDESVDGWLDRLLAEQLVPDDAWSLFTSWVELGSLPCLLPPPAGIQAQLDVDAIDPSASHPVLDRVRALLAKAEATTFSAEAEAFTAKAHELMARHMIDEALLGADRSAARRPGRRPITIRLPIDAPYATAKSRLVHVVADAGGCRAVLHQRLGLSSVVGHADDVAAVELLFTSLLVQAQTALHEQAAMGQAHRSRSFRSSFLDAYAYRIGERLRKVNDDVRRSVEAETGQALVPVLAEREAEVQDTFDRMFTNVVTRRSRQQWDRRGVESGLQAADRARLDSNPIDRSPVAGRLPPRN